MAKIYENQGKYKEAFLIYKKLYEKEKSVEFKEALLRIRKVLMQDSQHDSRIEKLQNMVRHIQAYKRMNKSHA